MQPGQKVVVEAFGENPLDAIAHHLKLVDQLPPNPAELGPTDVLVAVKRAAVGWVDLLMTSGQYQHMPKPPYCPGLEYSGLVTHVGPDVRSLRPGDRVNLERCVRADGRLDGHIVQGHVDGVGTVLARTPSEHWEVVEVAMPEEMGRYLVDKGSITVDGVSLTVVEARPTSFTVSLIPETLARTTLGHRQVGDRVNLETDVIAKHVAKLVAAYLPGATAEQHSKEQQA